MRRTFAAAGVLTLAVLTSGPDIYACGDKSLSAGGIRMQRALAARYPATILMYVPSASRLPEAARELKLHEALRQVGHEYREVTTWPEFQASVETGHFNIILVDVANLSQLQPQLESSRSGVPIVPVAYKLTKAETEEAAKQYRFLIKSPSRAAQYLTTIADAVRLRSSISQKG